MPKIELHESLSADKDRVFRTFVKYENHPKFIYGVKSVEVERTSASTVRVTYHLSLLKDIAYTLDLIENDKLCTVRWSLVKSNFFKVDHGLLEIKDSGSGKCSVRYNLEFELKLPVPGLVLKRLLRKRLSSIVKSLEKQAQESDF